jgi:hypothetical protein
MVTLEVLGDGTILVYIDDIVVPGGEWQDVWARTVDALRALTTAGFMINLRKCKFCVRRVKIVGQEVED